MKQSAFVISLLLANSNAKHLKRPSHHQYFAAGLPSDGDLLEKVEYGAYDTIKVGEQRAQTQSLAVPAQNATAQVQAPRRVTELIDKQGAAVGCPKGYTLENGACHFEFMSLAQGDGDKDEKKVNPYLDPYWWNVQPPEKVEQLSVPHAQHRTTYYSQHNLAQAQGPVASGWDANREAEKVNFLIPEAYKDTPSVLNRNAPRRTTFYAQTQDDAKEGGFNANIEPEKIHTLIPEAYRTSANNGKDVFNLGNQRTTFYADTETENAPAPNNSTNIQFDANIEPEKIHTLIPEAYRTTANDGRYVFNLGTQRTTFYAQQEDNQEAAIQQKKKDSIGAAYRDPWVYDYTNRALRDPFAEQENANRANRALAQSPDIQATE